MSIRKKTLIIVTFILICLMFILDILSNNILMDSYSRMEADDAKKNIDRAKEAYEYDLSIINSLVKDWATWTDTYQFMQDKNKEYLESNLVESTFTEFNLNAIIYINNSGEIVYSKGFDLKTNREVPISENLKKHITKKGLLNLPDKKSMIKGVIILPEAPVLVSAYPILTSEGEGPVRGTLIMARNINDKEVKRLAERTNLSLDVISLDSLKDGEIRKAIIEGRQTQLLIPINQEKLAGFLVINDIYGKPAIVLKADMPRMIYIQGKKNMDYLLYVLILSGVIFGSLTILILEEIVLVPLLKLSKDVSRIGLTRNLSARVEAVGKNELSCLGREINGMLSVIEQSQKDLEQNEKKFRLLAENAQDIIYRMQIVPQRKVEYVSPAVTKISGFSPDEHYNNPNLFISMTHPDDAKNCKDMFAPGDNLTKPFMVRWITKDKKTVWVEIRNVPIYDGDGALIAIEGIIRDITESKRMEERLKYFSLHDALTGLYNRNYYEEEMKRIETGRYDSVSVIICDLDGLKLINDTLGHERGDMLLKEVAKFIKQNIRKGDVVSRVGGDEFAVILPNITKKMTEEICTRIRQRIQLYGEKHSDIPLSVSMGYAIAESGPISIANLFMEADNAMCREKLNQSHSARSAIVETLTKALQARDFITEGHADRLQNLVVELGKAIGLSERNLSDLRLFAKFHDIGKVGIPDNILFKPGPLTTDEYKEMKRHSEIGFKIAQGSPDLAKISDWILKHHEHWNGRGYPLGLKGEEIPLECRMLGIVDAYDAMVSDRPYRKGLDHGEAVSRLEKGAGEQFDPELVPKFILIVNKIKELQ